MSLVILGCACAIDATSKRLPIGDLLFRIGALPVVCAPAAEVFSFFVVRIRFLDALVAAAGSVDPLELVVAVLSTTNVDGLQVVVEVVCNPVAEALVEDDSAVAVLMASPQVEKAAKSTR